MEIDDKGGEVVQIYESFLSFGERLERTWTKREQH
jgi:hypothetical protein